MTVAACVAAVIVDESDAPVVFAWRRRRANGTMRWGGTSASSRRRRRL